MSKTENCYFQIFGGRINNSSGLTSPLNESPSSVSNSQGNNENSGQASTGNSGQIVIEGVHSKIVKQFR